VTELARLAGALTNVRGIHVIQPRIVIRAASAADEAEVSKLLGRRIATHDEAFCVIKEQEIVGAIQGSRGDGSWRPGRVAFVKGELTPQQEKACLEFCLAVATANLSSSG
jgi:hypothetical protein